MGAPCGDSRPVPGIRCGLTETNGPAMQARSSVLRCDAGALQVLLRELRSNLGQVAPAFQSSRTRQQVRDARRVASLLELFRAEQVPPLKKTMGISQLVVSQLVAVWA